MKGGRRVPVAAREGETSRLISSIVSGTGCSIVTAGTLPSVCQVAKEEKFDLIVLEDDLLAGKFMSWLEGSQIFLSPCLILVAERRGRVTRDVAGVEEPPEVLWKPLDPEALYEKICRLLDLAGGK
jgi:DNA-binding response OmpR family regulator